MVYVLINNKTMFDKLTEDWQNNQVWYNIMDEHIVLVAFKYGIPHIHFHERSQNKEEDLAFIRMIQSGKSVEFDGLYDSFDDLLERNMDKEILTKIRRKTK